MLWKEYKWVDFYRAVPPTGKDPQIWHFTIQLQPDNLQSEQSWETHNCRLKTDSADSVMIGVEWV